MTFDCFLYNGEEHILNLRLHELDSVVDRFVILESDHTFQGTKKDRVFREENYTKFLDKITYIPYRPGVIWGDPWENERNQRNALVDGLPTYLAPHDIIMLSDVDEIPDVDLVQKTKDTKAYTGAFTFHQNFYYFNTHTRAKDRKWAGTVLFWYGDGEFLKQGFHEIRQQVYSPIHGGWHFSKFGDADYMIKKLESWSHTESNQPEFKDKEFLTNCIQKGIDPFNSPDLFLEQVEETYLPKYIGLLPKEFR